MSKKEEGICRAIDEYLAKGPGRMHVPGHKGKPLRRPESEGSMDDPRFLAQYLSVKDCLDQVRAFDVTEVANLDNLHYPLECIESSQERAARLFGAEKTFFLVNGATAGILASLLAVRMTMGEGSVVLPRNIHRSVVSGMVLSGLEPVFMYPEYSESLGGYLPAGSATLRRALSDLGSEELSSVRAVLTVNPTYYGIGQDTAPLALLAHDIGRGVPLIVDEAHGTHFAFSPELPMSAIGSGASIVIHGAHKTLPALTQTGLLHLTRTGHSQFSGLLHNVEEGLRLVQSSSPSYVLMASLEDAIAHVAEASPNWVARGISAGRELAARLSEISGLQVGPRLPQISAQQRPGAALPEESLQKDPGRVLVNVSGLGITGAQAARYLWSQGGVAVELAGFDHVLLVCTGGDDSQSIKKVTEAFLDLASRARSKRQSGRDGRQSLQADLACLGEPPRPERDLSLRTAFFAPSRMVNLEQAEGMVSCDTILTYPPGVAVILPGERFTSSVIDYIKRARHGGLFVAGRAFGVSEREMMTFCVDA